MEENNVKVQLADSEKEHFLLRPQVSRSTDSQKTETSIWKKKKQSFTKVITSSPLLKNERFKFVLFLFCCILALLLVILLISYIFKRSPVSKEATVGNAEGLFSHPPPTVAMRTLEPSYSRPRLMSSSTQTPFPVENPTERTSTVSNPVQTTEITSTLVTTNTEDPLPVWMESDFSPLAEENTFRAKVTKPYDNSEKTCMGYYIEGGSSGIYDIEADNQKFEAFCDMETSGGGWTVIQRRFNRKEYFYNRTYDEYVEGFGSVDDSHWLGLEKISRIALFSEDYVTLRVELFGDYCSHSKYCIGKPYGFWWGEWNFKLGDERTNYQLDITPPIQGNLSVAGDLEDFFYKYNNKMPFSALDRDNDKEEMFSCAQFRNFGGWWHNNCTKIALNGLYGDTKADSRYMFYTIAEKFGKHRERHFSIHPAKSIMMIRPRY
ncbi:unnamed protein product [Caenorhabditis auriculariae]|uniref:Fibrinogen C-terminal domain-containing protein n=1 Tax=Caenorhabditis auriculariae TaxID=2777116 RepID=A0A8S1H120_9PELO|nr:unnamed protein product [Caenorhabditis auriculariae]